MKKIVMCIMIVMCMCITSNAYADYETLDFVNTDDGTIFAINIMGNNTYTDYTEIGIYSYRTVNDSTVNEDNRLCIFDNVEPFSFSMVMLNLIFIDDGSYNYTVTTNNNTNTAIINETFGIYMLYGDTYIYSQSFLNNDEEDLFDIFDLDLDLDASFIYINELDDYLLFSGVNPTPDLYGYPAVPLPNGGLLLASGLVGMLPIVRRKK